MEQIENEYGKLWIKDGVMYGDYKEGITIDLKVAQKVAADRISLCNNKAYPFFGVMTSLNKVTKEARDFFSKNDGIKYMKKLALYTDSPINRMIGNFFLQISKPVVPTKLFSSKEEAINWLNED